MKTIQLMEKWEFHDKDPFAQPLFVAPDGRILRFALRPGQIVREHTAPHSPVDVVVLKGTGVFVGGDGKERQFGPNALIILMLVRTMRSVPWIRTWSSLHSRKGHQAHKPLQNHKAELFC